MERRLAQSAPRPPRGLPASLATVRAGPRFRAHPPSEVGWLVCLIGLVMSLTTACATGQPVIWVEQGVSLSNYHAVEVRRVANDTGQTFDFDVAGSLTDKVRSKLAERGVRLTEGGRVVEGILVLSTSLTTYAPGSAPARWVVPGAGTTECIVKGALLDGQTGAQLGVLLSHRSVSSGGLFSVGADQWILDMVATDIADAVANTLRKP